LFSFQSALCPQTSAPVWYPFHAFTLRPATGTNQMLGLHKENSSIPGACGSPALKQHSSLWEKQGGLWIQITVSCMCSDWSLTWM
jgi:hypothetical protein